MSISSQNPLIMPMNGYTNNNNNNNNNFNSFSPQEWEYIQTMRRTGWQDPAMQQQNNLPQSDPYVDFENEFNKCSATVQKRVLDDPEFKSAMNNCDRLIQSAVETIVRPQVMQTQDGRMAFERMLATFRNVRDKYSQEEVKSMERFQQMMQDEVVQKRLAELERLNAEQRNTKE